jgi:phosphoribosylglycinamide formyltransferase 2
VRIFNKPVTRPYRRMGVTLATADTIGSAREKAVAAAAKLRIDYDPSGR